MATLIANNETATRFSKPAAAPTSKIASISDISLKVDDLAVADDLTVTDDVVVSGSSVFATLDVNGTELILDADADTSLTADTDDQIDIKISGADDFQFTANTFTSLSGSTIATNTIAETTAGSGVTIDGCLVKDGVVQALTAVQAVTADGAIAIGTVSKTFFITKAGVAAMTLADPTATTHDGLVYTFIATTANAHTVDNSAGSGFFSSGGAGKDVATFGGAIGDGFSVIAYQGKWYVDPRGVTNVTLA